MNSDEERLEEGEELETDEKTPIATVLGGASWVFGGRVVKLVVGFVLQILVARILGTVSYGLLSLAYTVVGFTGLVAGLGVSRGVKRNVAYYEDEPEKARGVVRAGLVISIGSHILTAAAVVFFAPAIATRLFGNADLTLLIQIAAVGMPLQAVRSIAVSVTTGSRDAKSHTIVNQIVGPILRSVLVAGFVVLGYRAVGAVVGRTLSIVAVAFLATWLAWRVFPIDIRGETQSMYRELLSFSVPLMFAGWMTYFIDETDYFVLGLFQTADKVGTYTAMFGIRPLVLLFFFPATFLLSPVITRLEKEAELGEARRTYQAITKWTTLVSIPLFLLGFLFPGVVIRTTFGADYLDGTTVLRLLMVSGLVTVLLGANDRVMIGLGHSRTSMYVSAVAAGSNVGLNFLLIPYFGMVGAAVASLTAFAARNVLNSVLLYRWYGLTPFSAALGRVLVAVSVLAPIGYAAFVELLPVNFVSVTILGIVFLLVYLPVMIRLGASESIDQELFRQVEESQDVDLDPVKRVLQRLSA